MLITGLNAGSMRPQWSARLVVLAGADILAETSLDSDGITESEAIR